MANWAEIGGGQMANEENGGDTPHWKEKSSFYTNFNMYLILLENFTDFFSFPFDCGVATKPPLFQYSFIHLFIRLTFV